MGFRLPTLSSGYGAGDEAAVGVGAGDDGVDLGADDRRAIDHVEDRQAGLAFGGPDGGAEVRAVGAVRGRVLRFVIGDRLPRGGLALRASGRRGRHEVHRGEAHFLFGDRAAIDLRRRRIQDSEFTSANRRFRSAPCRSLARCDKASQRGGAGFDLGQISATERWLIFLQLK